MSEANAKYPRVLLGCPINIVKDYCLPSWLEMIKTLSYPNYDIYLIDNSRNPNYHKKLKYAHNVKIDYHEPAKKEARVYMAESIERIRQRSVKRRYDYLFILECDIFPPKQIIELLLCQRKPVIGTGYWTESAENTRIQLLSNTMHDIYTYSSRVLSFEEAIMFYDGKTKPIFANGNGCILIERAVLELLTFHVDKDQPGHADTFFHNDLFHLGIENLVDTSIIPKHWNSRWSAVPDDIKHLRQMNEQLHNKTL